jgi:predicted nucleotidyltransferase
MTIKELRITKKLSQIECAKYLGIPLRTYKRYESNDSSINSIKYQYIITSLENYGFVDEEHGKLTIEQIKDICSKVFESYSIEYCYLFGSYSRGEETEVSDVDLLVSMPVNGLKFYELVEVLREKLKKKVDLLDVNQLNNNPELLQEILRDGIKIYG